MKIGLISDLHTDTNAWNRDLLPHLIEVVSAAALDIFVIAGDIARHLVHLSETLNAFHLADLGCQKLFVPGNHDVWAIETPDVTSHQKCKIISELCHASGFHPLMDTPFVTHGIGFCGTIGWYDYSFAPEGYNFSDAQYAEKTLMGAVWNDKRYAKWGDPDPAIARHFEAALQTQIAAIHDEVSRIIVVTHHVPFRACIRYRGELPWDYFRAFMGSARLGELCLQEPLVTHTLFGHTHQPVDTQIRNVRAIAAPVGYLREEPTIGLTAYAAQALATFNVS